MTTTLVLFCLAIVGVSVLGGLLPLATVLTHTRLQVYLSFSAGAMLGAAFFHMMPEAVRMGSAADPALDGGRTAGLVLPGAVLRVPPPRGSGGSRRALPDACPRALAGARAIRRAWSHSAAPGGAASAAKGTSLHWGAAAFGLAAHSLAGGVALASASATATGRPSGVGAAAWGVFLATIVHKPADALTIVSLMLRAGAPADAGAPGQPRLCADDPARRRPLPPGHGSDRDRMRRPRPRRPPWPSRRGPFSASP